MTHLIIAGHGKQKNGTFDPGAIGLIKKGEHKYVVEDLFPEIKRHLPKGHNVVFFSAHKVSNYGDIVSLAKKYGATQITELHYDAASAAARNGHVIIHKSYSPDKVDLALRDAIDSMTGVRYSHKGHKGISGRDNLYNVNVTAKANITYRLIELGFGTNKTDADILVNKVDEYGKALVKAITGKVSSKPNKPTAKPKPVKPVKPQKVSGTIATIQDTLNKRYNVNIAVDNISGPDTKRALIVALQTELNKQFKAGLIVDGIWGPKTATAVVNVRSGAKGNLTWILQAMLVINGYNIAVDGIFDSPKQNKYGTSNAVKSFQRKSGLAADGIAGRSTFTKLFA